MIFLFVFLEKEIVLTSFLKYERSPMINPFVKIKISFSNDIFSGGSLKSLSTDTNPRISIGLQKLRSRSGSVGSSPRYSL